jgi:hypothetical protein
MLSDEMRSVAHKLGLIVVPYQNELGFTAVRESDDRYFVFVLNSGEWSIYRAGDVTIAESGSGPASFETALLGIFEVAEPQTSAARSPDLQVVRSTGNAIAIQIALPGYKLIA